MGMTRWRALFAVVCGAVALGCASGTNVPPGDGGSGMDADVMRPDARPPRPDAGLDAGTDAGPIDTTGMTCQPCRTDEDCVASHYCAMIGVGGRVCLPSCEIDLPSCPARFDCVANFTESLPTPVCAPVGERCCIDEDGDLHGSGVGCLGLDCDDDDDRTHAGATERCDGEDNDCNGVPDDGDIALMCPRGVHVAGTACAEGSCVISECEPRFADCDGDPMNGCETPTTTESSCGACGVPCAPANATGDCASGACRVATCLPGFADCNMSPADGCETRLDTLTDCGGCGRACSPAGAIGDCSTGTCRIGACDPNRGDCDARAENGCETLLTTNSDCGACRASCAPTGGIGDCSTGTCRLTTCTVPGIADCDMVSSNGCETNTRTLTNCGGCGVTCSHTNGVSACDSGTCTLAGCASGFGNCDGLAGNGCEQRLNTVAHCGACGSVCTVANGTGDCSSGVCRVASCNPGFGNCDGDDANGCEQPLNTLTHCGGCGAVCSLANAGQSCSTGACLITACNSGFGNCDALQSNGCEQTLTTLTHCGGCGVPCARANGSASCGSGSCTLTSCNAGFSNCDGVESNGCELRHSTAPNTCASATNVGSYTGDRSCGFICGGNTQWDLFATRTGTTSAWFRARVREGSDCPATIEHQIRLIPPAGTDYDLYVYRPCGTVVGSSTLGTGSTDVVTISQSDGTGGDDSFDYWVEVRWFSGLSCGAWSLQFYGHNC